LNPVTGHPTEMIKGVEILRRCVGAEKAVLVMEQTQAEPAEIIRSKIYFQQWKALDVWVKPYLYPQDMEAILKNDYVRAGQKEESLSVYSMPTAFAVYEAIVRNKPFMERVITVAGECIAESKNTWVKIGISFGQAVRNGRGLLREPGKLVMGGPMRGIAQRRLETPVLPSTSAILAIPKEVTKPGAVRACTHCGDCIQVCPVQISPAMIALAAEGDDFHTAEDFGAQACIECGNCSYVCPSNRPMVELIRYAAHKGITQEDPERELDSQEQPELFHVPLSLEART